MAQVYNEAGFDLGCPDDFYAADKWNVDGYFEQPEIHAVNMPLINGPFGKLSYFRVAKAENNFETSGAFFGRNSKVGYVLSRQGGEGNSF